MTIDWIGAYDDGRDLRAVRSACFAPFVSMHLDTRGNVLACCHTVVTPLGNIAEESLEDIWRGDRAEALRQRLRRYELPPSCRFCAWQIEDGNLDDVFAKSFDELQPETDELTWPVQIEFALSNRCNLQCVMCNGDFSSTIRSRREGRAPLATPYGDAFFEELDPFLNHLRVARFLGGEPFLIPEYQRIWDAMGRRDSATVCDVTTNGTVWTDRVERTLDQLAFSIAVSVDGASRETVERIRVGADFDTIVRNIERFASYCAARGTGFCLTYCLMTHNWEEYPDFLAWADELGAAVYTNTVMWPPRDSLYRLDPGALREVVAGLESRGASLAARPGDLLAAETDRLRSWLKRVSDEPAESSVPVYFAQASPIPAWFDGGQDDGERSDLERARDRLGSLAPGRVDTVATDRHDTVTAIPNETFLDVPASDLVGGSFGDLLDILAARYGDLVLAADEFRYADGTERHLLFDDDGTLTRVVAISVVDIDDRRTAAGATTLAALVPDFPNAGTR